MRKLFLVCAVFVFFSFAEAQNGLKFNWNWSNGPYGGHVFRIATLTPSSSGTYDHLHLVATANNSDNAWGNSYIDATFANRGSFYAQYTVKGAPITNSHLAAYANADGSVDIYFMFDGNSYVAGGYTVLENLQETVYDNPADLGDVTPAGTLVFDSNNPAYPPATSLDFAGRFGVGMVSPQNNLSVPSGINVDQGDYNDGNMFWNYYSNKGISFGDASGEGIGSARTEGAPNRYGLDFYTGFNKRMSITGTGSVGIGTATPSAWSNINLEGSGTNVQVFSPSSARLILNSNAQSELHFTNGSAALNQKNHRIFTSGNALVLDHPNDIYSAATLGMTWLSNGFVGIGTGNPTTNLEVNGTIKAAGIMFPDGSQQTRAAIAPVAGSGNVGIGTTSPVAPLTVSTDTGTYGEGLVLRRAGAGDVGMSFQQSGVDSFGIVQRAGAGSGMAFIENYYEGNTGTELVRLLGNGNFGIGTSSPTQRLDVNGNLRISGSGASLIFPDGTTQSTAYTGTCTTGTGGDYAESVDVSGNRAQYEPGDVIVIDPSNPEHFVKSSSPYSKLVAGIYSTKPGYVGRRQNTDRKASTSEIPMAMVGIVPTKVSAENGPILVGDLLVTSSLPGVAMKGTNVAAMMGAVVGKALGKLDSGTGSVEVLVSLQ